VRALVVEQGTSRGALAAVRALSAAGWHVGVGTPAGRGLASASRYCGARHVVRPAHEDLAQFLSDTADAVRRGGYDVVFGAGEAELLALSAHREAVPAVVPHPERGAVRRALSKSELADAATRAGLAVPRVLDPTTLTGESELFAVKAEMHANPEQPGSAPRIDTNVVVGANAARRRVEEIRALGGRPLVQEFHEGRLLAYSVVTRGDGDDVVAESMQVASHIWPLRAGASCRARTIAVDSRIAAPAARLLRDLGWFGLAELQFVVPPEGEPRLIDLNGRFYGSLSLAVAAGANLPAVWADLSLGRAVRPIRARPGVRYQWLHGDLQRAAATGGVGARVIDGLRTVGAGIGATHSVAMARDPAPALSELRRIALARRPVGAASARAPRPARV
jgi:predicted ATP-grasp superfamily ATP-dependent carboligase